MFHFVAVERREVVVRAIEGHRQLPAGVHLAEKDIRHSRACRLSAVPSCQHRLQVLVFPIQRHRAAGAEHKHHRLAHVLDFHQHALLNARQVDGCPVAAVESVHLHFQLLALQLGGKPAYEDHEVALGNLAVEILRQTVFAVHMVAGRVEVEARPLVFRQRVDIVSDTLVNRDGMARGAVIVAAEHYRVRRVGAHNRDALVFLGIKRQYFLVVLQQHDTLLSHFEGFLVEKGGVGNGSERRLGVEQTQLETGLEHFQHVSIDDIHREHSLEIGLFQRGETAAALQVDDRSERGGGSLGSGGVRLVPRNHRVTLPTVVQRPTVGDEQPVVAPLVLQDVDEQTLVGAARHAVEPVVAAHHHPHVGVVDDILERRQIGGPKGAPADRRVKRVAVGLRSAVHGEMLDAGECLVPVVDLLLETVHAGGAHARGEVGVFAVGFHTASPARVAEDVDVRGEKADAGVVVIPAGLLVTVEFQPRFVGNHGEHILHGLVVEGGGQCRGHRIDRGETVAGHPVQRLVPPAVRRYAQPLNGWVAMLHHPQLLIQSKLVQKQLRPLVDREARVSEVLLRHRTKSNDDGYDADE